MAAIPELATARLRLRPFDERDLDAWARITADADTMRFLGDGRPLDREGARASIGYVLAHWAVRGFGLWAAEERASGRLVGRIGLYRPDGWPGLEVGWLIARERWGEGFATEGARAALGHAFGALGASRVISAIAPANAASLRVAEKVRERYTETRRLQGHVVAIWAIERSAWPSSSDSPSTGGTR